MTVPVSTLVKPRGGASNPSYAEAERKMCFYLPPSVQANPPRPNDPNVFIETRPELTVYTRFVLC